MVERKKSAVADRVKQLVTAPDKRSRNYLAIANHFERMAVQEAWTNPDGSIYPIALVNLQSYIAFQEARVKPQTLNSYLSALREKHEQLGFLEWEKVRFHSSIVRMMRNVK